jgi:preprotein translocase subunit SecE
MERLVLLKVQQVALSADKGYMNIIQKPIQFAKEARVELSKVSWSTREELLGSTFVVIGVTLLMAVFIGVMDLFLSRVLSILFKI